METKWLVLKGWERIATRVKENNDSIQQNPWLRQIKSIYTTPSWLSTWRIAIFRSSPCCKVFTSLYDNVAAHRPQIVEGYLSWELTRSVMQRFKENVILMYWVLKNFFLQKRRAYLRSLKGSHRTSFWSWFTYHFCSKPACPEHKYFVGVSFFRKVLKISILGTHKNSPWFL